MITQCISLLLILPPFLLTRFNWTLADSPESKLNPEQIIKLLLSSAVALSKEIMEISGSEGLVTETFRVMKSNGSTIFSVRSVLPAPYDIVIGICCGELGNVIFHSSSSALVLQFTLSAPPEHTYSTPAGSRSA